MADYAEGPFERIVNVGWSELGSPSTVFAVDCPQVGPTTYDSRIRSRGSGLLPNLPTVSLFGPNASSAFLEGERDVFAPGLLAQSFTAGTLATICDGGDSVQITEGGELTITTQPQVGLPVPDFGAVERWWPNGVDGIGAESGDLAVLETCSGTGAAGRWLRSTDDAPLVAPASIAPTQNNSGNRDQRELLVPGVGTFDLDVLGHRLQWSAGAISVSSDRLWFVRASTTSSSTAADQTLALFGLRRGAVAGTVDGMTWHHHADMPGEVIFNWPPLPVSTVERVFVWYTTATGEGADKLGFGFEAFTLGMRGYAA